MKRLLILLAVTGAVVLGGGAPAQADTSDFSFSSFDAHYELSRDSDGRSVLNTTETLVAQFPDFDQNHGIVRELVDQYDGHPTDLDVLSVTDGDGNGIEYDSESNGDFLDLKIGDADTYVHGAQTYVIRYRQHDVTRHFDDLDSDGFFWDTNGTGWSQDFAELTATVTVAPDLVSSMNGTAKATGGYEGGTDLQVAITRHDGTVKVASAGAVLARQNVSFLIGFDTGTFTARPDGFFDSAWPTISIVGLLIALGGLVLAIVLRATKLANARGRGIIVPEYVPPKGVSLVQAALVLGRTSKLTPAAILDLAVKQHLRVIEVTGRWRPTYTLEFVSADGADAGTLEFLHALFGNTLTPGEDRSLNRRDASAAARITALVSKARTEATTLGYRKKRPGGRIAIAVLVAIVGVVLSIFASINALDGDYGGGAPVLISSIAVVLGIVTIGLTRARPLDTKGAELREYLDGLKVYIDLAEQDRIRYLQSPQGAERTPVPTDDTAGVLKLNEKLLPYAVLFGNEKKWAGELGKYYEQSGQQPNWYYGSSAFNAIYFASAIGALGSSAATSFSTASSSSSGGGGGFSSGGGGGGGGGGGW